MKIYKINLYYIKYLQTFDSKILWPKEYCFLRPYVGILIKINSFNFFAPLSSNRQEKKYWSIVQLDKVAGSIFICNMIPVPNKFFNQIVEIMNIDEYFFSYDKEKSSYGLKLFGQSELLKNKEIENKLIRKSKKIHRLQKYSKFYKTICCDFDLLQQKSILWNFSYWYLLFLISNYCKFYQINL